jgi:signal transduction histidine kinase
LKERLQVATRELERVSKIVRDYLDSTRRVKPEPVKVDLRRLAEESLDIALGAERRAKIHVECDVSDGAAELFTDPSLLRQILVNLCTNAADAGPQNLVISARAADGNVHLAVRDDGSGIAPEDAARIFEPFYTTKGRGKGTGLGLAICRELATALGGRISVESEPGHGSTFTLSLPRESVRTAA